MLPTEESMLLAKWQGPFEVKMGSTTFESSTPGQNCLARILYINLPKEWIPRPMEKLVEKSSALLIQNVGDEEVEEQYLPVPIPSVPNMPDVF